MSPGRCARRRDGAAIVRAEIVLDRAHRIEHALALWRRERCEDRAHLLLRAFVERGERAAARSGQREHVAPRIVLGSRAREPALGAEALENAAEIALVEAERAGKLGGADAAMVRELVHHAHFGQRKRTFEQALVEHADALRVEAVEASRGFDMSGEHGDAAIGYGSHSSFVQMVDEVNYLCEGAPLRGGGRCRDSASRVTHRMPR